MPRREASLVVTFEADSWRDVGEIGGRRRLQKRAIGSQDRLTAPVLKRLSRTEAVIWWLVDGALMTDPQKLDL